MKATTMKNTLSTVGERSAMAEYRNAEAPFIYEFFLVQGEDYRCMAYRDGSGKWRAAFNHFELPGAVQVLL